MDAQCFLDVTLILCVLYKQILCVCTRDTQITQDIQALLYIGKSPYSWTTDGYFLGVKVIVIVSF